MQEESHDRSKSNRKKKKGEKAAKKAEAAQLEEVRDEISKEKVRDKKGKKHKERVRSELVSKNEKTSEASTSQLEEGEEGIRVSGKKEKKKRKSEGDDGKEKILDSQEKNKKMKKKENEKEEQSIDLEEKVSGDNQIEGSSKKKKEKNNKEEREKEKDETGSEEIVIENEKDGDFKKNKLKKGKRKREDDTDAIDGENKTKKAKKTKKTLKSEEKDANLGKKKKDNTKSVRFSGEVEVFPLEGENQERETDKDGMVRGKRFTKEEDEILMKAIEDYAKVHQLGDKGKEMIRYCSRHKETKKCWNEITRCIPYRPKWAVYERAKVLLSRTEEIHHWTPEELQALRIFKEKNGNKWTLFGAQRGLNGKAVKDAWRRIRLTNINKGHWSQEEYQNLFDLVNMDLRMKVYEEKKTMHGMLRDNIAWGAISDKMSTRLHHFCCMKWYDQLSSPLVKEGLWFDSDDYRLIDALQNSDASCLEEVEWDHLLDHREGELCRKRWEQMIRHIGEHKEKSFIEQIEVLSQRYSPELIEYKEQYEATDPVD